MKSWFKSIIAIVAIALVGSACSTDKDINEGGGNLQINLKGIEEYVDADKIGKLASTNGLPKEGPVEIQSFNGFDVIASVDVQMSTETKSLNKVAGISAPKNINKVASTTPLANDVKYMLAFYDASNNLTEDSPYEITGTSQPTIQLPLGEYRWVAYSINSTTVPSLSNGVLAAADIANKDFVYAQGDVTIGNGDNLLNLIFKRMTSKFEVILDARGMFGKIDNTTIVKLKNGSNGDYLKTKIASFNVLEGQYGTPSASAVDLESTAWEVVSNGGEVKKVSFSVLADQSLQIPANSLQVELNPLKIELDAIKVITGYEKKLDWLNRPTDEDDLDKPLFGEEVPTRTFQLATVSLSHNKLENIFGSKFTINAVVVESPIQVVANGTKWARANLWYNEGEDAKYRFRVRPSYWDPSDFERREGVQGLDIGLLSLGVEADEGYTRYITDSKDLWNYGAKVPTGTVESAGFDPCANVYPLNLWKLPTSAEFRELDYSLSNGTLSGKSPSELEIVDRNDIRAAFKLGLVGINVASLFTSNRYQLKLKWENALTSTNNNSSVYDAENMDDLYLTGVGYRRGESPFEAISRPSASKLLALLPSSVEDANNALLGLGLAEGFSGGGFYWTRDNYGNSSNGSYFTFSANNSSLVSLGAVYDLLNVALISNTRSSTSIGEMSVQAGMNIRCVRNASYPNPPSQGAGGIN